MFRCNPCEIHAATTAALQHREEFPVSRTERFCVSLSERSAGFPAKQKSLIMMHRFDAMPMHHFERSDSDEDDVPFRPKRTKVDAQAHALAPSIQAAVAAQAELKLYALLCIQ